MDMYHFISYLLGTQPLKNYIINIKNQILALTVSNIIVFSLLIEKNLHADISQA